MSHNHTFDRVLLTQRCAFVAEGQRSTRIRIRRTKKPADPTLIIRVEPAGRWSISLFQTRVYQCALVNASTMLAGMRPRSETSYPFCWAHSRMALVSVPPADVAGFDAEL